MRLSQNDMQTIARVPVAVQDMIVATVREAIALWAARRVMRERVAAMKAAQHRAWFTTVDGLPGDDRADNAHNDNVPVDVARAVADVRDLL